MKSTMGIFVLCVSLTGGAEAAEWKGSPTSTFVFSLETAPITCGLAAKFGDNQRAYDCLNEAREKAASAYKDLEAKTTDTATKADLKKVYAAWLTYIGGIVPSHGEGGTPAETAFNQAVNELRVDIETQ